jgi:hypothetical protein
MNEFEEMTPYEFAVHVETFTETKTAELEEKLTLVWMGEYYHRVKKLPKLKDELNKLRQPQKPVMSDDQMLNMVKMLNAQFGGSVETAEIKEGE